MLIKVDVGFHRCGIDPANAPLAFVQAVAALPGLKLRGLLSHAGHAYHAASEEALNAGDYRIILRGINGPSGGEMLGRFCHLDDELESFVREHFRTRDDRNLFLMCLDNFGILGLDRRRSHRHVRAFHIRGFVALVNGGAEILQAFGNVRRLGVRARHRIAERKQHFGDAAHAYAADAY